MIQKVQIVSNNICYGPPPDDGTEVEQHLTISASGRVWFNGYNFICGFDRYERGRSLQFSIGAEKAKMLLDLLGQYLITDLIVMATDCGSWDMKVTFTNGFFTERNGALIEEIYSGDVPLSKTIREIIKIDDMFLFDGNYSYDEEDK